MVNICILLESIYVCYCGFKQKQQIAGWLFLMSSFLKTHADTTLVDELFMSSALEFGALLKDRYVRDRDQYRELLGAASLLDRDAFARTHFADYPEVRNQVDAVLRDELRAERLRMTTSETHLLGSKDIWGYEYSESLPKTARRASDLALALHSANLHPPAYAISNKNWETNWGEPSARQRNFVLVGILSTGADAQQRLADVIEEQMGRPAHRMRVNVNAIEPT